MARLPIPGSDEDQWGDILNDYLSQAHESDGTLKETALPDATATTKGILQLAGDLSGTAANPTVPGLTNHINSTTAHAATDLTYSGPVAAGTVKAAIDTLNTEITNGFAASVRPPTLIVAASDAAQAFKDRADYVCDGTDDQDDIQAALALGNVQLTEGTYNITAETRGIQVPSERSIRGAGPNLTIIQLQPADLGDTNIFPQLESFGVINAQGTDSSPLRLINISELTVDGNKDNMIAPGNENQGEGIETEYVNLVQIHNVHIINAPSDGIDADFTSGIIQSVTIQNCGGNGIHLSGGFPAGSPGTATRFTVVQGALLENNGADHSRGGIDTTSDSSDCIISGVIARNNSNAGLRLTGIRNIAQGIVTEGDSVAITGSDNTLSDFVLNGNEFFGGALNIGTNATDIVVSNGVILGYVNDPSVSGTRCVLHNLRAINNGAFGSHNPVTLGTNSEDCIVSQCYLGLTPVDNGTNNRFIACQSPDGRSEARGSTTIADTSTSVSAAHGLWAAPANVQLTSWDNQLTWPSAADGTNITISRSGSSGSLRVDWTASV